MASFFSSLKLRSSQKVSQRRQKDRSYITRSFWQALSWTMTTENHYLSFTTPIIALQASQANYELPGRCYKPCEKVLLSSRADRICSNQAATPRKATSLDNTVLWYTVEPMIQFTASDGFLIFDCYHTGRLGEQPKTRGAFSFRSLEFRGAYQPEEVTPPPGPRSFTSACH